MGSFDLSFDMGNVDDIYCFVQIALMQKVHNLTRKA